MVVITRCHVTLCYIVTETVTRPAKFRWHSLDQQTISRASWPTDSKILVITLTPQTCISTSSGGECDQTRVTGHSTLTILAI